MTPPNFAARWLADKRPAARRMLIEYLSLPLNAFRHEALIKRLFKGAEKAGDDEFDAPKELIDLAKARNYGRWMDKDSTLHTCFITTNDITGGNSGSPVINVNFQSDVAEAPIPPSPSASS